MVERPHIYYKINRNGFFPPSGEVLKEMWDTVYVRIRVGQVERTRENGGGAGVVFAWI